VIGKILLGTASVGITPAASTPMAGYYSRRDSVGVLDALMAKAVVLDDGATQAAIVTCDLVGLPQAVVVEARRRAAESSGIPAENIMISATHSHTAPVILNGSSRDINDIGDNSSCQEYVRQLPRWIAEAVRAAHAGRTAARLSHGRHEESDISFIRRFWMKDGTVGWNPGKRNPNILRPIGAIDPELNVVYAETLGDDAPSAMPSGVANDGSHAEPVSTSKPLWTFVNFALHLDTTGGLRFSADYPAALAARLADHKGPEMLTMFANGACGNINHVDVQSALGQSSPREARRLGTILAADVLKAYMRLRPVEDVTLRVRRETIELQAAKYTDQELRRAREVVAKIDESTPFLERVNAYKVLDLAARQGRPYEVDVQVFALGRDIAWVALPDEIFVELGLSIKAASPFRQTNVIELCGGVPTYVPHASAFGEGQYEIVTTRYAQGSGEKLVTAAVRLLAELYA